MKMGKRSDILRLSDILAAISALDRHRGGSRAAFDADELLQHFVWKQIEIIGEASSKLSVGLREMHPEVPWNQIVGMRNRLVHDYVAVEWDTVWSVFAEETVRLRAPIEAILQEREAHG